jgi:hypothetical protein
LAYWNVGLIDCFSGTAEMKKTGNIAGGDVPLLLYFGRISAEKELDVSLTGGGT